MKTICIVGGKEPDRFEAQSCDLGERKAEQLQREGALFLEQNQGEGENGRERRGLDGTMSRGEETPCVARGELTALPERVCKSVLSLSKDRGPGGSR